MTGRKGFYVEAGANDPLYLSTSLFFDKCLGWDGLCVEPNEKFHKVMDAVCGAWHGSRLQQQHRVSESTCSLGLRLAWCCWNTALLSPCDCTSGGQHSSCSQHTQCTYIQSRGSSHQTGATRE